MMICFKIYFISSFAAIVHLTTCNKVTGTLGKSVSLQWEFSNTDYEYFNLKKGNIKIAEYSTGNKQTFLTDYGKNRITVSWENTIFSLYIRNLTEEDKGAYTSKAVYNNELTTSIITLDISKPTRFTEALVKPATHILHANVGDDIEIKWKQVGNYENATNTSLGVDIFLDDEKTNSKNRNSTEKTVFVPLRNISRKMKENKKGCGIELNFNETNYILKLNNLTLEDSIHIRFVVHIGNKTESYAAQLKVHGPDVKQPARNYGKADDESSVVKWKTFAGVCISIIVIIILGVLVTFIFIKTGRLNLKFCGIKMTKMSTKQSDISSSYKFRPSITDNDYIEESQTIGSTNENISPPRLSLSKDNGCNIPPRPGNDSLPCPEDDEYEEQIYDDVTGNQFDKTSNIEASKKIKSSSILGGNTRKKTTKWLKRLSLPFPNAKKTAKSNSDKPATTLPTSSISTPPPTASGNMSTPHIVNIPPRPTVTKPSVQETNIRPTNTAIQINEIEEEEYVEPTMLLIAHQTTSSTTATTSTSSPTTITFPTTTEIPPHPKKYPLNLLPETSLRTEELYVECSQDVSDAGGDYEMVPIIPERLPMSN